MGLLKIFAIACLLSLCCGTASAQVEEMRIGILLDTSPEMGIVVPWARKEIRFLNQSLEAAGRAPVVLREFSGASMARPGDLSLGATRNVVFAIKKLYEEDQVDLVYWITALGGIQSGDGVFLLEQTVKEPGAGASGERQLIIRNIWQEQIQQGSKWVNDIPDPDVDPLHHRNFPLEWFSVVKAGSGTLIRSWRLPPEECRELFGYPYQLRNRTILRKLQSAGPSVMMDPKWRTQFLTKYGLKVMLDKEFWVNGFTGRRSVSETTLIPFLSDETRGERDELIFQEMSARESIEEDLTRIEAKKIGVLFGFGFLDRDIEKLKSMKNRPIRDWKMKYMSSLTKIVSETREHISEHGDREDRVYVSEMVGLSQPHDRFAEPDRYARRMADLVRRGGVDAIYFFTNGYTGGGEYGHFEVDLPLIAAAIREANVRLFVRVPFEFGAIPIGLQQLALASGGGVILGTADDPDWQVEIPDLAWPEPDDETGLLQ